MHAGPLPEQTRREIFAALVDAQDAGVDGRRLVPAVNRLGPQGR